MNTHENTHASTHGHPTPAIRRELWPASREGDTPVLVEYAPVPEPLLLRYHPTRQQVSVYALHPHPADETVMVRVLISSSIVEMSVTH